jgi:hypothetical protein
MVQLDRILTETKVVDRYPEVFVINDYETGREQRERDHTRMRLKDSWTYVCTATITRKYIVASVTIVRNNAENLGVLLFRYVYQTITRNADKSKRSSSSGILRILHQQPGTERNHVPNAVPIEFGANRLKASTGI